ncbi:MAG: 4Fe-4S binding protein [Planctomycetota bacterium]
MSKLKWDPEAEAALAKAPFFVRPLARRKVEQRVRERGADRVTLADVREGEARFRAVAGDKPDAELARLMPRANEPGAQTVVVEVCHCEVSGCPNVVIQPAEWKDAIEHWAGERGVHERLRQRIEGPRVLHHHKLRISISGCPNGCSRPQIADVGLMGRADPLVAPERCDACGACARACPDGAIDVEDRPVFDREVCLGCAVCRNACPNEAIALTEPAVTILMGGKLGRHPHLADVVGTAHAPCQIVRCLGEISARFLAQAAPGERFADFWIRTGLGRRPDPRSGSATEGDAR